MHLAVLIAFLGLGEPIAEPSFQTAEAASAEPPSADVALAGVTSAGAVSGDAASTGADRAAGPAAAPAALAPRGGEEDGAETDRGALLLKTQSDVEIAEDERAGVVIVLDGDAEVAGRARALAVLGGDARLRGGHVGDLLVTGGRAELDSESVIEGDVHLRDAELAAAPGATIRGEIVREAVPWERFGRDLMTVVVGVGAAGALVLGAMLAAALAPAGTRRAGRTLTGEFGKTVLAALVLWIAAPLTAAVATLTVIGAPAAMAVLWIALPALAIAGYLVAAVRVGDAFLERTRRCTEVRPIGAGALGALILFGLGVVPFLGPIVTALAILLGGGALLLTLFRRARAPGPAEAV